MLRLRTLTRGLLVTGLAALLAGCAWHRYEARPLEPERGVAELAARSLDSPELRDFARANLPADRPFPPDAWDLSSLTQVALFYRRELDVARAELASVRASVRTASTRPNPTLSIDPEVVPNAATASQRWVLGGILDFPIETANKRGLRTLAAEERARAAELDLDAAAWTVRVQVFAALSELAAARADLAALRAEQAAGDERLADLRAQLDAGRLSRLALAQAEEERARLALDVETARTRAEQALAGMAEALGVPRDALEGVPFVAGAVVELPPAPEPLAARELGLTSRYDLSRSLVEYAVAEAELRLEVARQYPDVHLGPGASLDQGDHKYILGFSLELPLFDRNEGPIAEAEARRTAAGERFLALQERAIGAIESARLGYAGALRERAAAQAALATARAQEERLARVVAAGAVERGALLDARVASARLERARAVAEANAVRALGELELELQRPLAGEPGHAPVEAPPSKEESGT